MARMRIARYKNEHRLIECTLSVCILLSDNECGHNEEKTDLPLALPVHVYEFMNV